MVLGVTTDRAQDPAGAELKEELVGATALLQHMAVKNALVHLRKQESATTRTVQVRYLIHIIDLLGDCLTVMTFAISPSRQ